MIRCLLALALLTAAASAAAVEPGNPAPPFSLPRLDGGPPVRLGDYRGEVVLVDFWASWCSTCLHSMPAYDRLLATFGHRRFSIIAISVDEQPEQARHFLERHPVRYITAIDSGGHIARHYDLKGMPTSYLIDRSGRVRYVNLGFQPDDSDMLAGEIEYLLEHD